MKRYSKSQLAEAAGVSYSTFARWLKANEHKLIEIGYQPSARLLSPRLTDFICAEYGIDEEDLRLVA